MARTLRPNAPRVAAIAMLLVFGAGCTSFHDYVHNGFKVGPSYGTPCGPVAPHWIDAADIRQAHDGESLACWWRVFNDPKLNHLIACAYRQNLTVKQACFRVLEARALLAVARGELFPQSQYASGGYTRSGINEVFSDRWNLGFTMNWELDFWGRLRRAIAQADDNLNVSVADYDDVLVTMFSDIALYYTIVRTNQQQIIYLKANADLQRRTFRFIEARLLAGFRQTELDRLQTEATLKQTEAGIPSVEISMRQAENALCVLLGMPPADLEKVLGRGPIPVTPPEVAIGVPADLLRRRPDVRRAQFNAAAQGEQIGITEAQLYPYFYLNGNLGYSAQNFSDLLKSESFVGSVGPSFNWNLLNYGRIANSVRYQDARFQELAYAYQQTVISAAREVENGLVTFLKSQQRTRLLQESVTAGEKAVHLATLRYRMGVVGVTDYTTNAQNLVTQQNSEAVARGDIAQGLIATYRALGGGWDIRLQGGPVLEPLPPETEPAAPTVPPPEPVSPAK